MGSGRAADPAAGGKRLLVFRRFRALSAIAGLLLSASAAWAQVPIAVSEQQVPAGGQFSVSFVLQRATVESVSVDEPDYPDGIRKTGGPLIRPSYAGSGLYVPRGSDAVEVELTYTALRPGRYIIGPFTCNVTSGSGPARQERTGQAVIAVTDPAHDNRVPPEVRWIVADPHPYQGQAVFVELALVDVPEPLLPEQISTTPPAGGVFEEVRGLGKIRSSIYGRTELFQVPIATYFFTPTTSGDVTIPPANVTVDGATVSSKPVDLNVAPLPPAAESSGAVGSLNFSAAVADPEITEGDSFDITLRVDGTGNLSYFKFPEPVVADMVVTSSSERSRYVPTEHGYTGYREVVYQLSPKAPGVSTLRVPAFHWLDPSDGNVHISGPETYKLTTDPAAIAAAPDPSAGTAPASGGAERGSVFTLLSVELVRSIEPRGAYHDILNYLWLLPGMLVLAASILLRRRKGLRSVLPFIGGALLFVAAAVTAPFPENEIRDGISSFQSGRVENAVADFTRALQVRPHSPGILYNLALCDYQAGSPAEAVYALANAIRFRPENGLFRQTLDWMEKRLSLTRQIDPPRSVNPDLMLIITAILFNLTCVLIAVSGAGRSGRYVIVLVFSVLLTLTSAGGLIYAASVQQRELGVIGRNAGNLLKIPRPDASRWIELPAGTTVEVLLDSNGFYLIRTGYGVEGWIPADDVLYNILPAGPAS
ncbi:BatD family protein [Salinispira pacifica]